MTYKDALYRVISGLMEIPLPKDGKTIGIGKFKRDIEKAYSLARRVQWASSKEEINYSYEKFRQHIDECIRNNK